MALRKNKFQESGDLLANNASMLAAPENKKQAQYTASVLTAVIAEICDAIVRGEITHCTFGMPQAKNALLFTVNWPDKTQSRAGGVNLDALAEQMAKELLDTGGGEGR